MAAANGEFRFYLQQQLLDRCRQNPRYSLRAFARFLALESSSLSKVLRGERSLSPRTFDKIAQRLGFSEEEKRAWSQNIIEKRGRPKDNPTNTGRRKLPHYNRLSDDAFQVMSDWYYMAILELVAVKKFKPNLRWIARVLNLSYAEVGLAVERLERLGLLRFGPKNKWIDCGENLTNITPLVTSGAHIKFQKQVLSQALRALEEVPVAERDQTTLTMAIDSNLLPVARERIREFRREMGALLQDSSAKDEVFQLSISLFPVSHCKRLQNAS